MTSLSKRLKHRKPILLDGATGTELQRRGLEMSLPLWSAAAIESAPELLRQVHADYAAAGAEILTANTFRTHARSLAATGVADRAADLTRRAVEIARAAAGNAVLVAGSQAPLEDCYAPELVPDDDTLHREHRAMARHLAAAGVDLILVETHNSLREAAAAARAATETALPVLVSFVCGADGKLLSGETLTNAAAALLPFQPAALLVNCVPADAVLGMLSELRAAAPALSLGAYANVGRLQPDGTWLETDAVEPVRYAEHARSWLDFGAKLIGGCCGTTPEHIRRLRELIDAI